MSCHNINITATLYFNGLNFGCLNSLFHLTANNSSVHVKSYVLVI